MRIRPPGQVAIRWHGHTAGRWLLAVMVAAVVAGCAQPGNQSLGADQGGVVRPPTVTVGPADDEKTVDLQVGDRLIVQLDTAKLASRFRPAWTLRLPPSKVLKRVQGGAEATRVMLFAAGPGTVRLVLVKRFGCAPPLRCPVPAAGPSGQSERMRPPLPGATVVITVRVQ